MFKESINTCILPTLMINENREQKKLPWRELICCKKKLLKNGQFSRLYLRSLSIKATETDMGYFAKSKFSMSLVRKKNFSLI